jgi:hypothetical protein
MAFEIVFKYYECLEDEIDYDKSKVLTYTKNLGDIFEDVSLEMLASMVFTQLARRDIFVFDLEIFELVKKKISYKQSKNNILIKNKKFGFSGETIVVQEIEQPNLLSCKQESEVDDNIVVAPQLKQQNILTAPAAPIAPAVPVRSLKDSRPLKKMIFVPSDTSYLKGKPLRFTPNKVYSVYREKLANNGIGMILCTIDDMGREVEVTDEYFINDTINLINENAEVLKEDVLNWSGSKGIDMPDLRRG